MFNAGGEESSRNALVAADFNLDGKPDLANAVDGRIAILLSGGANGGIQAPPTFYKTALSSCYEGSGSTALAVGDFNGDGKPDIALGNEGVSILAGNGDGTFQAPVSIAGLQDILPVPVSLAVGELDGDGLADIAVTFRACTRGGMPGGVVLLFGTGDGSFRAPVVTQLPGLIGDIKAADIDGDGKLDLIISSYRNVTVLAGNGDGTYQVPVSFGAGEGAYVMDAGDINGDGRPDIVTANFQTRDISVLLNSGPETVGSAQASAGHRFGRSFAPATVVRR